VKYLEIGQLKISRSSEKALGVAPVQNA